MGLVEELYRLETEESKNVWSLSPFSAFNPSISFLRRKQVRLSATGEIVNFFEQNLRANFFPNNYLDEAIEEMRFAMNRGIDALNGLCQENLGDISKHLTIPQIDFPLKPGEFFAKAINNRIRATNGKHKGTIEYSLLREAYDAVRSWGLGNLVLIIDESPEVYQSIMHRKMIAKWMSDIFKFKKTQFPRAAQNLTGWNTEARVNVYGRENPFRHRLKIHDDDGEINYGSILMKMFRKSCFVHQIYDTYGIEMLVANEVDAEKLLSFFRSEIRGGAQLERYENVERDAPQFHCHKFIMRIPIRVPADLRRTPSDAHTTVECPPKRYMRLPVEMQIRPIDSPFDHAAYKKKQYAEVFPLWYPREIYGPILAKLDTASA